MNVPMNLTEVPRTTDSHAQGARRGHGTAAQQPVDDRRTRKLEYMSLYNARDDVKRRAREREQTPKYKAMRKLYRDKQRALKQGLTPSQIAARIELGLDLLT